MSRTKTKILLPLLVLVLAAGAAVMIFRTPPEVARETRETPPPLVRVLPVQPQDVSLDVTSQGTVAPHTESTLVAQVAGKIISVAPGFATGGFFRRGEVLVRIDRRDYELAVAQAQSTLAQAKVRLERQRAEAEVAREEWEELGRGEASPLALREPQLAEAEAAVEAAEAALAKARLDLERTAVRAPYGGRVRAKRADIGQFVSPGTPVASVFATDWAEVRLPVAKNDLAFLALGAGDGPPADGPAVRLTGELGGTSHSWRARVVRTAGEIDPGTRMLDLFARIDDPFDRSGRDGSPALPIGLFVEATITGRTASGAFALPRAALRGQSRVLVVDDGERLRFRTVEILRTSGEQVFIGAGLAGGERVVVSPMETPVDGMRVRTVDASGEEGDLDTPESLEERL